MKLISLACCFLIILFVSAEAQMIQPYGPTPNKNQLAWHEMEFYLFMHFGPNTFSGLEWGHGTEDPNSFHPTEMDCRQWARIARDAGAKGIIITAKHHDGFCLFPSRNSNHTVKQSKWRDGKGDVLEELSKACREYGLKFGVYISPWDRNHPKYGTSEYNSVYVKTMQEVIRKYGPLFEMWWDGANGEGPNGKKQEYDFGRFERTMRKIAPNTIVFSDIGPDVRWVGNERGVAGQTNWNLLDTAGFKRGLGAPHVDTLNQGNVNGKNWIPAECDVSIRPGWFYHSKEDSLVKSGQDLMRLYLVSVGRGANFLLNVPPDTRGLIHGEDSAALMAFRQLKEEFFKNDLAYNAKVTASVNRTGYLPQLLTDGTGISYWAAPDGVTDCFIEMDLGAPKIFNTLSIQEYIQLGQRVKAFSIEVEVGNQFKEIARGTTIGHKRILQFPAQTAQKLRVHILDSKAAPVLSSIKLYNSMSLVQ